MQYSLPEGYLPLHPSSWDLDTLQTAAASGDTVQATVLYCDKNFDLHIDLFPYEGIIPCEEVALAAREKELHKKALLFLVGRPVFARVIGRLPDGRWLLSRAEAQRQTQCQLLCGLSVGDVLPAVAVSIAPFGVFCDIGCGLTALLPTENISAARVSHAKERFRVGQRLYAAVSEIDRQSGRISLTHRELLGTWKENADRFLPGQTVRGVVRGIRSYGVFVELTPNLSGLAEYSEEYRIGDAVSVFIKSILPRRRKIKLNILGTAEKPLSPTPFSYFITEGNISGWCYHAP